VGQFNVVGYLEMGNAQLYQAIQRREKVISFEIRKAAARPALLPPPAGNPTSVSRRKQQVTEQAAQMMAESAGNEDRELAVNALALGRRATARRPAEVTAGPTTTTPIPAASLLGPPARQAAIDTDFRQPVSRQPAIEIEDSQDGCIPTPSGTRPPCTTRESVIETPTIATPTIATPTELTARSRTPSLPRSVPALVQAPDTVISDETVLIVLQDAFSKRLDSTLTHVVNLLAEEHNTTQRNILTTNAHTWLVEQSGKIAGWGSVEQFMDIEGMGLHKVATFGPRILSAYRELRKQALGDVECITPEEMEMMHRCADRHRTCLEEYGSMSSQNTTQRADDTALRAAMASVDRPVPTRRPLFRPRTPDPSGAGPVVSAAADEEALLAQPSRPQPTAEPLPVAAQRSPTAGANLHPDGELQLLLAASSSRFYNASE
jgi:hypothetical protein